MSSAMLSITDLEWWKPQGFREIALFVIVFVVIVIWVMLIHYSIVNSLVKRNSRCLREQNKFRAGATFSVGAYDAYNKPLYSAEYDFSNKKYSTKCACASGNQVNQFKVKVFDLKTQKVGSVDKTCSCDIDYNANNDLDIYYKGYPGLVSYMENDDTSFFSNQLISQQQQ